MKTWKIIWNLYRHPEEWQSRPWYNNAQRPNNDYYSLVNDRLFLWLNYFEYDVTVSRIDSMLGVKIRGMARIAIRFVIRRWYRLAPLTAFLLTGIPR